MKNRNSLWLLAAVAVLMTSPALAASKSTTLLQADLLTYKTRDFNAEANYSNLLNLSDSLFNKTTDTLDDVADGSTYSLIAAADATKLAAVTATAAELNATSDISGRIVTSTDAATLSLVAATHGEKIVNFNDADGAITLPAASGTGVKFTVRIHTTAATAATIEVAADTDDAFVGTLLGSDTDAAAAYAWTSATDDTISLNGVATGGKVGDWIEVTDVAAGVWMIKGALTQSGGSEATPFSAAISAP